MEDFPALLGVVPIPIFSLMLILDFFSVYKDEAALGFFALNHLESFLCWATLFHWCDIDLGILPFLLLVSPTSVPASAS